MKIDLSAVGKPLSEEEVKATEAKIEAKKMKRASRTARGRTEMCWVCRDLFKIVNWNGSSYVWSYFHSSYRPGSWYKKTLRETHDYLVARGPPP